MDCSLAGPDEKMGDERRGSEKSGEEGEMLIQSPRKEMGVRRSPPGGNRGTWRAA